LDNYTILKVDDENNPIVILGILTDINNHKSDNSLVFEINTNNINKTINPIQKSIAVKKQLFTNRQKEIISLIKNGDSSKEIAEKLGKSIHTINAHRRKMLEKFNCKNSSELLNLYHSYLKSSTEN
jgi:DNA-binding CsgD family transcriptional regulator